MNGNNFSLRDHTATAEEMLGPPRIDAVGVLLISLASLLIGGLISAGVLIASFFSVGQLTANSGASPIALAMATFFVLLLASWVYLLIAKNIFPTIYTKNSETLKHIMMFMIILYATIQPLYLFVGVGASGNNILMVYVFHLLLAIFGIELILGVITGYRYLLLSFYSNIIAVIVTTGVTAWIFNNFSSSTSTIFILMGLSVIAFFFSTSVIYLVKFLYYKFYTLTGNDPLGTFFSDIETQEKNIVAEAQNNLFQ